LFDDANGGRTQHATSCWFLLVHHIWFIDARRYYLCAFGQIFVCIFFVFVVIAFFHHTIFGMSSFIHLENLHKSYTEGERGSNGNNNAEITRTVLNGAKLSIASGETVALLGRSGSGKSTLLNLLSGIDTPDEGEVMISGRSIHSLSEHDRTMFRRKSIGFIFQFFNLLPTLTVEENILLPLELNGILTANEREGAHELLERVGLLDRATSFPDRLSGGEQQRVAVVRALVHKPLLLLADEPTGNLDTETGARVLALILELVHERKTTLLMATHSADAARQLARVITVHNGQICETVL
jgi:putative ABC transport system ATP-binding protein